MIAGLPGLDEPRVTDWIDAVVGDVVHPLRFARIGRGQSNITYRVTDATGRRWVLRRPPLGVLLPSAHDVVREYRILAALCATGCPVPRPLGQCTDAEVTGAPFYLMDHASGEVIADRAAAARLSERTRTAIGGSVVRVLADLHRVDVDSVGLGDLARRDGYAARQLRRWRGQWEASKTREIEAVERVADALEAALPEQHDSGIVHGDYKLDNLMVDGSGTVTAVLDWELCTLGDPLADVGLLLAYWTRDGDDAPLGDRGTSLAGFPSREELVEAYAAESGRDVAALSFYRTLAYWKLAVIVQGVYRRAVDSPASSGPDAAALEPAVARLSTLAESSARGAGIA
jgi:aminoglycoside phosphotransferase (APT) family kinase protein